MGLTQSVKEGVAVFNNNNLSATIIFTQYLEYVEINYYVSGLKKNGVHGFHIHEAGDLREGCSSCCNHYNPHNKNHGGLRDSDSHAGDLGNLEADENGISYGIIKTNKFSVSEIIGRSVVIHADPDDLGRGWHKDSLTTGHSGSRIGCGIIGISKNNCK